MDIRRIIAIDIETTSLDTATTDILEVGLMLLDGEFTELDRKNIVYAISEDAERGLPDFVRAMHESSGLLDACHGEGLEPAVATEFVRQILEEWTRGFERGQVVIGGSGILHFDVDLIAREWPEFLDMLPYWIGFDIAYVRRFDEQVIGHARTDINAGKTHRAMDDLECHTAEMRAYAQVLREAH